MILITGIPGGITLPGMAAITTHSVLGGIRTTVGTLGLVMVGAGMEGIPTTCTIPGMVQDTIPITNRLSGAAT